MKGGVGILEDETDLVAVAGAVAECFRVASSEDGEVVEHVALDD